MEKYNLDEKGGLFKFVAKSPLKIVKSGDGIEVKHSSVFNFVKGKVAEVTDTSIRVQCSDKTPEAAISAEDHVALYYASGDIYVITGEVGTVSKTDPIEMVVKVVKIEKLKDLIKEKKHIVGFSSNIKIIGVPEAKPAQIKNISFGGVKANCREDIQNEDIVEFTVYVDKMNKMPFKGRVVRKNKMGGWFEYGVEYTELTESGNKLLTRIMYDLDAKI